MVLIDNSSPSIYPNHIEFKGQSISNIIFRTIISSLHNKIIAIITITNIDLNTSEIIHLNIPDNNCIKCNKKDKSFEQQNVFYTTFNLNYLIPNNRYLLTAEAQALTEQ